MGGGRGMNGSWAWTLRGHHYACRVSSTGAKLDFPVFLSSVVSPSASSGAASSRSLSSVCCAASWKCHFRAYTRRGQNCPTFRCCWASASTVILAPHVFSPSSFKKILQLKMVGFFICTFAALRDINSCNRSSVVSGSKLPTYRTALFTEGFVFVTYFHESSSESHTGGVVRRAHACLSSLCRACTCWSSRERGRRTGTCATRLYGLYSPAIFSGMAFPCSLFRSSSLSSLWLSLFLSVSAPLSGEGYKVYQGVLPTH